MAAFLELISPHYFFYEFISVIYRKAFGAKIIQKCQWFSKWERPVLLTWKPVWSITYCIHPCMVIFSSYMMQAFTSTNLHYIVTSLESKSFWIIHGSYGWCLKQIWWVFSFDSRTLGLRICSEDCRFAIFLVQLEEYQTKLPKTYRFAFWSSDELSLWAGGNWRIVPNLEDERIKSDEHACAIVLYKDMEIRSLELSKWVELSSHMGRNNVERQQPYPKRTRGGGHIRLQPTCSPLWPLAWYPVRGAWKITQFTLI